MRKALSSNNIKKGLLATRIFPLDWHAVDKHLVPSNTYIGNGTYEGRVDEHSSNANFNKESEAPRDPKHEPEKFEEKEGCPSFLPVQEVALKANFAMELDSVT